MKKLLVFLSIVFLLSASVAIALGQEIPKGSYGIEPSSYEATNAVSGAVVYFDDESSFFVHFSQEIQGLTFHLSVPTGPDKTKRFVHPNRDDEQGFKDIQKWQAFATNILKRMWMLDESKWVDTVPWKYVGKSLTPQRYEVPCPTLVFQTGEQVVAVPEEQWVGPKPVAGSEVIIGRSKRAKAFFPVLKAGDKYGLEPAIYSAIDKADKENSDTFVERK